MNLHRELNVWPLGYEGRNETNWCFLGLWGHANFGSAFHFFHFCCRLSAFPSYRNCPFDVLLLLPLHFQILLSSIESPLYTHKHKTTQHEWKEEEERNQFNPKPPPSLRVIANLLIVLSVSGENCFKCFFLRAWSIPLPLVLSCYFRGLNLVSCVGRVLKTLH